MLYRFRKSLRMRSFDRAIGGIFGTPPLRVEDAPWSIVSMVAKADVAMYLLALKSFYPKLGRGKVVAIIDRDMPQTARETLVRHVIGLEFVILEDIPTGECQRGGTWERLLYVLDRSEREYTIQLDSDTLSVGDLSEVVYCVERNIPFAISDGFEIMSLPKVAEEAEATPGNYIGIVAERLFARYPGAENLRYVRGSSGFAGFAWGGFTRAAVTRFHQEMERLIGAKRWREWGTEQSGSNFAIANSPGAIVLPRPDYATFLPRVPRREVKFFHFIGTFRFMDGYFAARGQEEIAQLNPRFKATLVVRERPIEDRLPLAFTRTLTVGSGARYLAWKLSGQRKDVWLRLRSTAEFQLRPRGCGNSDAGVAYEIFVHHYLVAPVWIPPERVSLIVDLGANVGLSCLYWLTTYRRAHVIAFEAHPAHAVQCRVNLAHNRFEKRVTLYTAAAGAQNGQAWISDAGAASCLSNDAGNGHQTDIVDIFPLLSGRRIDILKVDIEGSEYELLDDPRFGDLDVRAIVLEWHHRDDRPEGHEWCCQRLNNLGFRLFPLFKRASYGMMWGYKITRPSDPGAGGPSSPNEHTVAIMPPNDASTSPIR